MDWLVVVGGQGEDVARIAQAAEGLDLRVIWASGGRRGDSSIRRIAGYPNPVAIIESLQAATPRRSAFLGVMAGERAAIVSAWQVAEALGLPRLRSLSGVQLAGSRLATLARLAESGVRVPSWRTVASPDDLARLDAGGHPWEWALKIDRPRSSPVILPTRRMRAAQAFGAASAYAAGAPVYAQRWLPGAHLSAVGALVGGRVTTLAVLRRSFLGSAPDQVTCGWDVVDPPDGLIAVVESVARACRWTLGPIVVDVVAASGDGSAGSYTVVDAHPGIGEAGVPALVGEASLRTALAAVCGKPAATATPVIIQATMAASLRYVVAVDGDAGRLIEKFEDRPRRLPAGIVRLVRPGERIREGVSRSEVWGWAIAPSEPAAEILAAECYASVELEGESDVDVD